MQTAEFRYADNSDEAAIAADGAGHGAHGRGETTLSGGEVNEPLTLTLWKLHPAAGGAVRAGGVAAGVDWWGGGTCLTGALSRAVGVTAVVALVVGAVLAAGLYAAINEGVWAGVLAAPLERAGFFLGRSALFALLWGTVLGFVWLVKAQELNRRLGMRMVDEGEGKG
jgi:hypothetical protein